MDDACEGPLCEPRGIGGALWMYGCRWLSDAVRGLITMSAGFGFPPVSCRLARRRAKLMGGAGSACKPALLLLVLAADGWRCVCVGGESEGLRESVEGVGAMCPLWLGAVEGGGGGLGCRADEDMASGGAFEDAATMDRLGPPPCVRDSGGGLRLPMRAGRGPLEDGPARSSCPAWGLTTFTSGGAVGGRTPAVLPRRCSMSACCCCFRLIMDLTCSIALGSSSGMVKPITTGEMPLSTDGRRTSVSTGMARLGPTRRFLAGFGGELDVEGGLNVDSRGF